MVRFIIGFHFGNGLFHFTIYIPIWLDLLFPILNHLGMQPITFTFQYGQIYYASMEFYLKEQSKIYIPIWLDLLSFGSSMDFMSQRNLHSNMVRFIMRIRSRNGIKHTDIYIPIWLDLLFVIPLSFDVGFLLFTFQYGQIYYRPQGE